MNELKKMLVAALGLTVTLGLAACDVEEECEVGPCADTGGAGAAGGGVGGEGGGAGGEGGGASFTWVLVQDTTEPPLNMAGTPGADICGISTPCGTPVASQLVTGEGELCDSIREGCAANRADSNAAEDDGGSCEAASEPSDYVSLGGTGTLSVQFSADLSGCSIDIVELEGRDAESYEVYVCDGPDASSNCVNGGAPLGSSNGGPVSVDVP